MGKTREDYPEFLDKVSVIDFARLAAFVDGEGCIYINMPNKTYGRQKGPQARLQLMISNTDPRLMNWLKTTFDGCVYNVRNTNSSNPLSKKQVMHWQVNEKMAFHLLERMIPFMLIKRQQAEVGLAFMKLKKTRAETKQPLTEDELLQRRGMKAEISRLNHSSGLPREIIQ